MLTPKNTGQKVPVVLSVQEIDAFNCLQLIEQNLKEEE